MRAGLARMLGNGLSLAVVVFVIVAVDAAVVDVIVVVVAHHVPGAVLHSLSAALLIGEVFSPVPEVVDAHFNPLGSLEALLS